ncbi:helix-turn-helix domain-containing protein [Natronobacterium texcoconense]|nr:helix-turn-helix domain-containing protein [Natronobacterium texcoconense]
MRYVTVVLCWSEGELTTRDATFARSDAVFIEAIRHLNPLDEDRYAELLELRGDLECARSLLADAPDVTEYDVAGDDGHGIAYVQCRTVDPVDDLLSILHEHDIVVDWPMEYVDTGREGYGDRGLEVTIVGPDRSIQRAVAALPEAVGFDLRRTGEYEPGSDPTAPALTPRQRELFELAVREGYYEVPRGTTHRELASQLGLAPGTVSEHLQRIEAKLADAYASSVR